MFRSLFGRRKPEAPDLPAKVDGIEGYVAMVRDFYVSQFQEFMAEQKSGCIKGAGEIKYKITVENSAHRSLGVVDYIKIEPYEPVEFEPTQYIRPSETFTVPYRDMAVTIEEIWWGGVRIRHDGKPLDPGLMDAWFETWFDPDDKRYVQDAPVSGNIHKLDFGDDMIHADLGTADAAALWELLDVVAATGARRVHVARWSISGDDPTPSRLQ